MKVGAEDRRQVETDIGGVRYRARDGYFDMPEHHARAHLVAGNLPLPNLAGAAARSTGYRCPDCGHGSFFKRCKCGAECVKES